MRATPAHGHTPECAAATRARLGPSVSIAPTDPLIPVESFDDIPEFANECEEAEFWSTHSFGEGLLAQMVPRDDLDDDVLPPPRPRTRPVVVRFDDDAIGRLKVLAGLQGKEYPIRVRDLVLERLYEEEKRAGLVGS